ncbi:putative serine esterase-domain-containing protein [Fennellomyces sp. T-0311]|nr:putative serine esterase-domain-containing protein [Fennellomyces sp. T-0311]
MPEETTLIVLQHGLWGTKSHMSFLEKRIVDAMDSKAISILNVDVNENKYTYDGIQDHVKFLAEEECGLMARYAVGLLGSSGFFNTIEPLLYVTFATPHLGVRKEPTGTWAHVYNYVTGHILSRTGEQLQLLDDHEKGQPLLRVLADPDREYYRYLSKFKARRVYANVANDRTVPYWTAAMDTCDYFHVLKEVELSLDTEYSSIITGFDVRHPDKKYERSKRRRIRTSVIFKYLLIVLSPIVVPILGFLALTYIGTQGLVSRYRVSQLLSMDKTESDMIKDEECGHSDSSDDTIVHHDHHEDPVLVDTLDAVNAIPESDSPRKKQHHTKNRTSLYNVEPSKALSSKYKAMHLSKDQFEIQKNMRQLDWERVLIYIGGFNAHGSIVCRQSRFENEGGRATIRHFVDSLLLD